ncbi:Heparan-alpha-glucosaminide N-acetyltransferase [Chionoecetes opilio]|uniref:Heparan-alpha-glucosaminide N-acetyltransferase n=1 Tax=Chionoecetes opilio TaxID=41210 RepID=A0A8J8WAJ6_CHIOP|nr:Heparan-alpha-glucosaminide N-acetyltransferase [Chionoecetes opilio]
MASVALTHSRVQSSSMEEEEGEQEEMAWLQEEQEEMAWLQEEQEEMAWLQEEQEEMAWLQEEQEEMAWLQEEQEEMAWLQEEQEEMAWLQEEQEEMAWLQEEEEEERRRTIVICLAIYAGLGILGAGLYALYRRLARHLDRNEDSETQVQGLQIGVWPESSPATTPKETPTTRPPSKPRLKSLDTFRGISIVVMIFVNYGAGSYWFLEHAAWHGLQVADLVFPWFMWIMGVCIPMGLASALRRNTPRKTIFLRIFKRSVKLFLLGIILNSLGGWVYLDKYRVPGVLQRFAICYLVTASIALAFTPAQPKKYQTDVGIAMSDVLQLLPQWAVHLLILAAHTLITFLMPVSGCPTGYQGPGGFALLQNGTPSPHCVGGSAGEVDRWLLTSSHIYQNPTAKTLYGSAAFDPEGVLGSLTSIFQVFLGLQAGITLRTHTTHQGRLVRWLAWAVALGALGTALCGASMNDGVIPVNKNLWSLSYVFVTSCFAFLLLSLCYLLTDVWGGWSGAPFFQAGMNSIFLYVGHNLTYNLFPWHYALGAMNTHLSLLVETLWGTTLWTITALYLHCKGKFYTV